MLHAALLPLLAPVLVSPDPAPAHGALGETIERLIVLNKSDSTLMSIDPATSAVEHTVPTGSGPHEVAVSADGRTAVVSDYGAQSPGSTLTVIDLVEGGVVRRIALGDHRRPHGIEFLDEASQVIVTTEESQSVLVVDVPTGKVVRTIETGQQVSHMVVTTPDRERAFVANIGSGSVSALDLVEGRLIENIVTGGGAEAVDVTPDGREVWIGNRGADTLTVIDAHSLEELAELPCAAFPIRLKFTPDGKHALVSAMRSAEVVVFDVAHRTELRRIRMNAEEVEDTRGRLFGANGGPLPIGILIEPTGRRAYIANTNADTVTVIDLETWKVETAIPTGREPDGMAWSSRIADSNPESPTTSPQDD